MKWIILGLQLFLPAAVAVYTINFGRWMNKRGEGFGAGTAYVLALLAFGLSAGVLLYNNNR
ncbi:hypothetical protein OS242_00200 [Tumebacillus sp. DT12]|uniref:Uncharacterized protein n=1 Tax=Tumebacillus lacus TaxID=2995335 RepID=A0ABT3WX79_9BACL|nr:hypothetical protein [Tumebacillus lacus]MCX7568392.1 hypothetical protein [Tumebacillus lacus]